MSDKDYVSFDTVFPFKNVSDLLVLYNALNAIDTYYKDGTLAEIKVVRNVEVKDNYSD